MSLLRSCMAFWWRYTLFCRDFGLVLRGWQLSSGVLGFFCEYIRSFVETDFLGSSGGHTHVWCMYTYHDVMHSYTHLYISVHVKTFFVRMNVSSRVCVTDTCSLPCRGPLLNESLLTHDSPTHSHVRMSHVTYMDAPCHTSIESRHIHEWDKSHVWMRHTYTEALSLYLCPYLCICGVTQGICIGIYMCVRGVYESRVIYARSHWVTPHTHKYSFPAIARGASHICGLYICIGHSWMGQVSRMNEAWRIYTCHK